MKLAGARILIVGGVRRLGGALAGELAAAGAAVCVTTRDAGVEAEAQVAALERAGAARAAVVRGDVSTAPGARRLVAAGADALGGLDALVFAASGPFIPRPPEQLDEVAWDASFDTIAKGFFFSAGAARERFLDRCRVGDAGAGSAGVIVALTDYLGLQPWANFAGHGAAKAAQIHLVRELARAWADDGVRVCGVAPGPVDLDDDAHRAATLRAAARSEQKRLVDVADVALAVRFALENEGVTGANVIVDGGALLTS